MCKFLSTKKGIFAILLILILGIGVYFSITKIGQYLYIKEVEQKNTETIKEVKDQFTPQNTSPDKNSPANSSETGSTIPNKDSSNNISSISTESTSPKQTNTPPNQSTSINQANTATDQPNVSKTEPATSAYLEVPFITQAPLETTKNWELHENSCEEAAVLQAYLYESGQTMTKEEANTEILKMIDWEIKNLGGHNDLYADGVRGFINGYYGIPLDKIEVVYDANIDDIKKFINQKHPVIVPIMGDILKNPFYPYPGYHMLVVTGYTKDRIITNDNGTKHGKDFTYDNETFLKAMQAAGGDIVMIKTKTTNS
jgi:hypothetical protein